MSECCVYIIAHEEGGQAVAPVKVGVGKNPTDRLRALQTGNPKPLILYKQFSLPNKDIAHDLERAFHVVKGECRLAGEWFDIDLADANAAMHGNLYSHLTCFVGMSPEDAMVAMAVSCGAYASGGGAA